jgi:hypothetical protein
LTEPEQLELLARINAELENRPHDSRRRLGQTVYDSPSNRNYPARAGDRCQLTIEIAEIVHDIDLRDDKFHRLEAAGLNAIIDGLSKVPRDDRKLLQQTGVVFDGLHALLSKDVVKPGRKTKRNGRRSKK